MCAGKPECQRCETCGRLKYQLWMSREMHDRGCPFGAPTMGECAEARNHAGLLQWSLENGVGLKPAGIAFLTQMERLGAVDRTDGRAQHSGAVQ